jgi:signal transduction histidine kinase
VVLTVSDDGKGFETGQAAQGGHHLGIASMRERARRSGGRLKVTSAAGEGTTIRLEVPHE